MATSSLFVLMCASVVIATAAEDTCEEYGVGEASNCTSGFPSLLHIDKVAGNTNLETKHKRQVVIPALNFSCNGGITRWIVGAKWGDDDRDEAHTELQIWRRSSTDQYMKVNGTTINVGSVNASQVYELETSLAFQEGDILGYFQPDKGKSELDLYLEKSGRITTYHTGLGGMVTTPPATGAVFSTNGASVKTSYPLIAVITDPPGCGCGFMSVERVYALLGIPPLQTGNRRDFSNQQLIFPSIRFTCSGQVVKWIMAGKWNNGIRSQFPELQIWRSSGDSTFERLNSTVISIASEEDDEVYEFPVATPLPFQPGDILGVRQPTAGMSKLQVRYDNGGDSVYYATGANQNKDVFDISGVTPKTDIPLVTVEIVELQSVQPSSSSMETSSPITSKVRSTAITSAPVTAGFIKTSVTETPATTTSSTTTSSYKVGNPVTTTARNTVTSASTSKMESMTTTTARNGERETATASPSKPTTGVRETTTKDAPLPSPPSSTESVEVAVAIDSPGSGGLGAGAVVGLVLGLIIVLLLAALTASLLLLFLHKRRQRKLNLKETNDLHLSNPNYATMDAAKYTKNTESAEVYASPYDTLTENQYAVPDVAQHYEAPVESEGANEQWGIYVPTTHQRSLYQEVDDIYSSVGVKPVVRNGGAGGEESSFFTESDLYWVPASDTAELYEQLSRNHFREIQRDKIQITKHLGSGQFGTVSQGVWQCPGGQREVAVKLLQAGAATDNRVKFLKEAAIMGQFSHRNVTSLHGVVTLGEPVMIVMELMSDGDLRENLIATRPTPGELPPLSLSQQLLDFCHQISAGMAYLSSKAFVHRDLAARNILVSGKTCKIADFGMARDLEESNYYISQGGQIPVKWTAPEALHYKKYSTASDVWSFGCLMYEIWSLGHKPFEGYTNVEAMQLIRTGRRLAPPPGCPREIYKLMISCWHPKASERPRFSRLLQTLSLSEHELLLIPEEVTRGHPQASVLGAPLEAASDAYTDLQNSYINK